MSYLDQCLLSEVENEYCVIPFYQTTSQDLEIFKNSLSHYPDKYDIIAIHWKVEVADDNNNGWFEGTAIHYCISKHSFHIIVASSNDTGKEGCNSYIPYDYRVIRLIQCLDGYSFPLFNKILRDHIIAVQWEIDYYLRELNVSSETSGFQSISSPRTEQFIPDSIQIRKSFSDIKEKRGISFSVTPEESGFGFIRTTASFYSCANNLLIVKNDSDRNGHRYYAAAAADNLYRKDGKYLLIYADSNYVSFLRCLDSHSLLSEFKRLIIEEHIPSSLEAQRQINHFPSTTLFNNVLNALRINNTIIHKTKFASCNDKGIQASLQYNECDNPRPACVICCDNEVCNEVFIPCGHQAVCYDCCKIMFKSEKEAFKKGQKCPICRIVIRSSVKVYLA